MSRDPLRFYPRAWRERYGDELRALIEDDLNGRPASRRYRTRLAAAGLAERARASGMAGDSPADARRWAGSSIVLFAWVALCAAGASFAKSAEHFQLALLPESRLAPSVAYDVVVAAALAGAIVISIGAAVALPGFVAAVRSGRARGLGRSVRSAGALTALTLVGIATLSLWARHLDLGQRNGRDPAYAVAFATWFVAGVTTLALWARIAARASHLSSSPRVLRVEARLAVVAAIDAAVVLGGCAWWWVTVSERAPWFIAGTPSGSVYTAWTVGTAGLMALAVVASGYGVARIVATRS